MPAAVISMVAATVLARMYDTRPRAGRELLTGLLNQRVSDARRAVIFGAVGSRHCDRADAG